MCHPRRLAAVTIRASSAYVVLANPRGAALAGCFFLALATAILALILLPAVWSRKKYRREAAYGLAQLIIGSRQM